MSHNEAQHRTPCLNREQHVPGEACGYMRVEGLCGLYSNPAKEACPPGQCDRRARQEAREDSLRMSPADLKQARAPGKMFSRSDILAILRGQVAVAKGQQAKDALSWVANIFENLE